MIANDGHIGRGSARSIGDVNIYQCLKSCQSFFETFGGHVEAAGFSIKPSAISEFIQSLRAYANTHISNESLSSIINIDLDLPLSLLTKEFVKEVATLEPFGNKNEEPVFYTNKLKAIDFKCVGNGDHLKATFTDVSDKIVIEGIGFGLAEKINIMRKNKLELAFNLTINEWRGVESPQLQLLDIK